MEFSTRIAIDESPNTISYDSQIVSIGSCFAVNIAQKLEYFRFRNMVNPFGILFHPLAIEKFIGFAMSDQSFSESDVFFNNGRWHCFDAHSDLSDPEKKVLIDKLKTACQNTAQSLGAATHLIITLGTAWVYRNIGSGEIVANCHKVPQKQFTKELLSVETISESLNNIISMFGKANPSLHIIFTISPVRHLKDGFVENQRSKAHLFTALHAVLDSNPKAQYFPSYEIMTDELRDYRFYADDMLHPSQMAIDYIWQRFAETHMSAATSSTMKEIDGIQRGLSHRPFNPESREHGQFLQNLNARIDAIQQLHPHITF